MIIMITMVIIMIIIMIIMMSRRPGHRAEERSQVTPRDPGVASISVRRPPYSHH